ncbi:MAG: hypothetical protein QHH00_08065 [Methanomassiliicoccales archaeon]|jgi:rubrerythrin|nr:hypothetical protein [Methanomassiliicoccales archaeon]
MVEIRTTDELLIFLQKALEIELSFETMSQWESYINLKKDEFRDVVFELISESEKHRAIVEELMSRVKMKNQREIPAIRPREFNFKNKTEFEIMMELSKYEKLAYDIYKNIYDALKKSDMKNLFDGDPSSIFSTLDMLIKEESDHQSKIANYVGKVERIR